MSESPDMPSARVSPDCLSDLALDRFVLAANKTVDAQAGMHLSSCVRCAARLKLLEHHQQQPLLPLQLPSPSPSRLLWQRAQQLLRAVAVPSLACAMLVLGVQRGGERSKGVAALRISVLRDAVVEDVSALAALRSGDALQFTVTLTETRAVRVVGQDAVGRTSQLVPVHGFSVLPAGVHTLPGSAVLDDAVGEETLWIDICDPSTPLNGATTTPPPGCERLSYTFQKAPR